MAKFIKDQGALGKKVKAAEPKGAARFELPKTKTTPITTLLGYIMLLFGEKKIGKTSMLAESGDRTFFAFFEPGGKALSTFSHVFQSWAEFKLFVMAVVTENPRRFNHVVIDTVDIAYKVASKAALKKLGIDHEGDAGFGKGWAAVREEFETPIMKLVNSGVAVTFVSHADDKEIELRDGSKYTKLMPTMPKQARGLVEGLVDIWAYYGYDGQERVLTILGDDHIAAGHRLVNHFKSPSGVPIRTISMGSSAKEAMANFQAAFDNRYTPVAAPKVVAKAPTKLTFKKAVKA